MKTKKGDWVRVCYNGISNEDNELGPWLGFRPFRVMHVVGPSCVTIASESGRRTITSWVRCEALNEEAST